MNDKQVPIGSGFGARTTAVEVVAGLDLSRKCAIVTGGHSGLGLETTRALAGAGAKVIIGARNIEAARYAVAGINGVQVERLDLSDLESVGRFAERIVASGRGIDILINSAGIMACPQTRVGDGWEAQFATNHLGHFALVNGVWPAISRNARVVSVSSGGHQISGIRWDDVQFEAGYDKWQAYGQSKTANALFALHLDRLAHGAGIRAFSLHPGKILTPLQRYLSREEMVGAGWIDANGNPIDPTFKTPSQGAATQLWAATSPQLEGMGGLYCEDCDVADRAIDGKPGGVSDHATDPEQAERLWVVSARLTGIDAFAASSIQ
ncbi:SDR family NAD(P)-dependent oxidoreductase [Rhizobium bangladeshense]|uniref:SDR family NAD(P)-dependent oxidoreductase n=1 Tax=Rhizobium bangladeshense TaxID=1138189 RepID=UPI0007E5A166|nr:SDR family NAD(P)-dependent oxidoreductase [Rhizobium bangladeshense]